MAGKVAIVTGGNKVSQRLWIQILKMAVGKVSDTGQHSPTKSVW